MEQDSKFMDKFIEDNPVSDETIKHFASIAWTNDILQNEAYEPVPTYSRVLKPTGEDYFFSRTINTPKTIPHYLTLKLKDFKTPPKTAPAPLAQSDVPSHKRATIAPEWPDCVFLLTLGETGIDGHPGVVHGGMACAILDETMGLMVMLHDNNVAGNGARDLLFTINLNVSYRARIPTPGEVMVRTWLVKREERKWYSKGQIVDNNGTVLTEADGLWLVSKAKL